MALAVVLEAHVLHEYLTTGEWCHGCLLPSAVRLPWALVNPATMHRVLEGALVVCQDCGRHWDDAR